MYHSQYIANKQNPHNITANLPLFVDDVNDNIDLSHILQFLQRKIPARFYQTLKSVHIKHLREFEERKINALFKNRTIYVSGFQENTEDILRSIVHELGHVVEYKYHSTIYGDQKLEKEFLLKRKTFFDRIQEKALKNKKSLQLLLMNPEYSTELDDFFYNFFGYDRLGREYGDVFVSPYSITSLSEYWGVGFETYFIDGKEKLVKISPVLFNKIEDVVYERSENDREK